MEEAALEQAGRALLENLPLAPWASRRRQDLSELLDRFNPVIAELTTAVEREANKRPKVLRLMTHPGVGPLTALAFVLIIGDPFRFARGKQIGSYVGFVPCENSSAGRQRLGHISKQGNKLLRFLLVEAAQVAVRLIPLAAPLSAPGDAPRSPHRESGHGTQTCRSLVLDVAQRLGLFAVSRVRFARGTARGNPWWAVDHRGLDGGPAP